MVKEVSGPGVQVKLLQPDAPQLGEPQPRGIRQFQNRVVAEGFRGGRILGAQQRRNFFTRETFGQAGPTPGKREVLRHVFGEEFLVLTKFIERSKGCDLEVKRTGA